jgi:hypothetical protein
MTKTRDIWVDFNGVETDNRVSTLAAYATSVHDLAIGVTLIAGDDQGNLCEATVVSTDSSGIVVLALDPGTFRASSPNDILATA